MRQGLEWYKREPRAILDSIRAARMTDRQAAVYNVVLDLIYAGAGETPNDPAYIAAHFSNIGSAAARKAISDLVEMGKLAIEGGMLTQKRAKNEAKTREKLRETRAKIGRIGGERSAKSRSVSSETNSLAEPIGSTRVQAEKRREEIEEKEEPIGSSQKPASLGFQKPPKPPPKHRASSLPEGWVPSEKNVSDAMDRNFTDAEIADEADRFRDYHLAKGSAFKCWDAAWRTWLGNARKFGNRSVAVGQASAGRGQPVSLAGIAARRRASAGY